MEEYSRNSDEGMRLQLLDLIPKERNWVVKRDEARRHGVCEDKKLELRLGPPGEEEDWTTKSKETVTDTKSLVCFGYTSKVVHTNTCGSKRGFIDTENPKTVEEAWMFNNNRLPVTPKESSQPCCTKLVELQGTEKKGFSPASANNNTNNNNNTAVPNTPLQKRAAPAPVVGWPPIRSFRKNIANSSSLKSPLHHQQDVIPNKVPSQNQSESSRKGLFVKINMDGVPIGRKVDLKAYDSYDNLASAVDELFRGLLAAQKDSSYGGNKSKQEGEKAITGLLDGSGEYTLVYEDNEGDRMLVGDVPWHMFVSTVKRLRVLKSSEVSALFSGSKQEKNPLDVALK